ncbi:protein CURVATURE THYLAKOID 1D, chloroplastic-like [Miscanthus floridulus]|uniref:protein CURVATURE THYLAKOID 1D, chloroplastic-like n=1 Tax=Miscanthus floridulus TaxID=154761 RepID=UPI003457D33C
MALTARAALMRVLPPRPSPISQPKQQLKQGLGGRGGASLAVRAKGSDDFGALLSEKPAAPAQAPAKRDGWEGFGREASSAEEKEEVEVQGEPASWGVLNQIGVELDSDKSYSALVYGTSAVVAIWISSIVVSALDSVPLVPQVMEVVGLGFTIWFTSRYLIFKENRDELITRVSSIKKQILGSHDN